MNEDEVAAMEADQMRLAERLQRQMLASGGGAPVGPLDGAPAALAAGSAAAGTEDASRVGRNDPCPCGSGKKYKHCHGQLS